MHDQDKSKQQLIDELETLRQQVADQQRIHESLPVIVATTGFDGYYTQANAAFEAILGWPEQEVRGRLCFDFIHPDDRAEAEGLLDQVTSGETLRHLVVRFLCKDGSCRWINWVVIPLLDRQIVFGIGKDVTQQRQAEQALRQSERRYRQLADSTPDVIYILDETGKLLYANRVAGAYFGVDPESLVGKTQHDLFPPEKADAHLARIRSVFETGETLDREDVYRFGDREVWLNVRTLPLRDEDGRVTSLMGICRDVTERKRAEQALKRAHDELEAEVDARTAELREIHKRLQHSHDELEAIYDATIDGLLVTDIETERILRANTAACRMLGYTEEEIKSLSISHIHPPEVFPTVLQHIRSMTEAAGHTPTGTVPFVRKDAGTFLAEITGTYLIYDGKPCSMGVFRDVTERLRAEQSLRQSHDELQAIYDQAVEGIVIVDSETANPLRANAAFREFLGYTDNSVFSIKTEMLHPPEVMPAVREYLDKVKDGSIARIDDLAFLRTDGATVYADVISSPIHYSDRACWISFFHDVTERKQIQDALEQERQSLWRMLQASDHERQIIAYDIHDGLAQYLAAAGMQFQVCDSLKERSPDDSKRAYETAVELVRQAHAESRRLISEVRHPVIDEQGLETAITSLVYEQRRRGGPRIECHTSVDFDRLPPIVENALYRMTQEALTNAREHSGSDKIIVSLIQQGQEVRLEVRDWGIGFDTKAIDKGHFGLESIRQRVRLLGGRLTIDSKPDVGTVVTAVVPIVEEQVDD